MSGVSHYCRFTRLLNYKFEEKYCPETEISNFGDSVGQYSAQCAQMKKGCAVFSSCASVQYQNSTTLLLICLLHWKTYICEWSNMC